MTTPTIIPRAEHSISRKEISPNALKVLYRIHHNGFHAYLVGGGVRDLLLGKHPKDFDLVTDAHPEEISELFGNCRLIGRRFRLAHIRFGKEIIEVATFRAGNPDEIEVEDLVESEHGMLVRDNVYGTLEQDVWRRDFTINALYYNIDDFTVVDYVGGMEDILNETVRLIGDPEVRYREDPVRMLRAVRFAAKLNFTLEEKTAEPIRRLVNLLDHIAPARLFEEYLKLFSSGSGFRTYQLLLEYQLFEHLFPHAYAALQNKATPYVADLFEISFKNTDERVKSGQHIAPAFLLAVLMWPRLLQNLVPFEKMKISLQEKINCAIDETFREQRKTISIPRRFSLMIKEMWQLQWRMQKRDKMKVRRLLGHPRLRAAYDFLELRAQAGEPHTPELAAWWMDYLGGNDDIRKHMEHEVKQRFRKHKKYRDDED